jgi:Uri superfamily endonuclease
MKGIYALLIDLERDKDIGVGNLGSIYLPRGHYLYIGSAMNGIEGRVKRHLGKKKKTHWHIDYLLKQAKISDAYYLKGEKKQECIWAKRMAGKFKVIKKFGSSDCDCIGHLFYGEEEGLVQYITRNKMKKFQI